MSNFWEGFEKQAYIGIGSKGGIGGLAAGGIAGGLLAGAGKKPGPDGKYSQGDTNKIVKGTMIGGGLGSLAGHYLQHKTLRNLRLT